MADRTEVRRSNNAGVVEDVGKNVPDLLPSDELLGSSWAEILAMPDTFAEFTVVPSSKLIKRPIRLAFEQPNGAGCNNGTEID